jgi:dihydroorotate dehydrogenase (NAD+) catalytic subunit
MIKPTADLQVMIAGLRLKNPVMTASGTFGYASEFVDLVDLNRLGAIVVKGLSLDPSIGNPPPRIVETPCGMLNAIGLENVGIKAFINEKLPFLRTLSPPLIVNIYGKCIEEYCELARHIENVEGISAIEVNISCPNVKSGGIAFGVEPQAAFDVISAVRKHVSKTLIVKLSPNVTDITQIARSVVDAGGVCLPLPNPLPGGVFDIKPRPPKRPNTPGVLWGPAIRPVAVRMVWQVAQAVSVPVIGIGGIMTASDALEFLIAGASAVQVGTANFVNPRATLEIIEGIEAFMVQHHIEKLSDITGTLKTG